MEDNEKNAPTLLINHEKVMHLIVISHDLQEFHHLHPEQVDSHRYQKQIKLTNDQAYTAFVDITVEGKNYLIEPILINDTKQHQVPNLKKRDNNVKVIHGKEIKLNHSPFITGEKVDLNFQIKEGNPDPYLGALGHVVIVDEKLEKFIHVHPISDSDTIFEAHFENSGRYKLWAEFKFGKKIIAFPYVFEVEEASTPIH